MRWKHPPLPQPGDIRVITKFLFRRKTLNRETRWLERSSYVQVYAARDNDRMPPWVWRDWMWAEQAAEARVAGELPPRGWLPPGNKEVEPGQLEQLMKGILP
jgi:hypothetical protein